MFDAGRFLSRRAKCALFVFVIMSAVAAAGCKYTIPVDTTPLDAAGVNYDSIQQLKALKITAPEVAELAKAKQGHLSDNGCVEVLKIFHSRGAEFNAGDAITGLVQVGTSEDTILQLARLNQLGLGTGELQAMRLAGLSDQICSRGRRPSRGREARALRRLAGQTEKQRPPRVNLARTGAARHP